MSAHPTQRPGWREGHAVHVLEMAVIAKLKDGWRSVQQERELEEAQDALEGFDAFSACLSRKRVAKALSEFVPNSCCWKVPAAARTTGGKK